MITSSYNIFFTSAAGTRQLLGVGDMIEDEITPKVTQKSSQYAAIGAGWGEAAAEGGAMVTVDFTVRKDYASHAVLRSACLFAAASFPASETGTLRIEVVSGDTWDILNSVIVSSNPIPYLLGGFRTLQSYSVTGGKMIPAAPLTGSFGSPHWEWPTLTWENITTPWNSN